MENPALENTCPALTRCKWQKQQNVKLQRQRNAGFVEKASADCS